LNRAAWKKKCFCIVFIFVLFWQKDVKGRLHRKLNKAIKVLKCHLFPAGFALYSSTIKCKNFFIPPKKLKTEKEELCLNC
jgi:hypothetical protein